MSQSPYEDMQIMKFLNKLKSNDKIPPSLEEAIDQHICPVQKKKQEEEKKLAQTFQHQKEQKKKKVKKNKEEKHICQKCQKLQLNCNPSKLSYLGPGYPLFFNFLKYCIFLLVMLTVSAGAYNFFSNGVLGEDCIPLQEQQELAQKSNKVNHCELNWITLYTLANKRKDWKLNLLQEIINIFSIFLIIFLFQKFRLSQRKIEVKCDTSTISITDYTILVYGIPKNFLDIYNNQYQEKQCVSLKEALKVFFSDYVNDLKKIETSDQVNDENDEEQVDTTSICVSNVNCLYNIQEITNYEQQKEENILYLQKQLAKLHEQMEDTEVEVEQAVAIVNQQDSSIHEFKEQIANSPQKQAEFFTGQAFISFKKEEEQNLILEKNKVDFFQSFFKISNCQIDGQYLQIVKSVDPTDVIWINQQYTAKQKRIRSFLSFILTCFLIFGCFCIIFTLSGIQEADNKLLQLKTDYQKPKLYHQYQKKEIYYNGANNSHILSESPSPQNLTNTSDSSGSTTSTQDDNLQVDEHSIKILALEITLVIQAINYLLVSFLRKLTEYEKHQTRTEYYIGYASKLSVALFFNTSLNSFFVKVMFPIFQEWDNQDSGLMHGRQNIYSAGGLVYNQQFLFLLNTFLTPLIYLIDFGRLFKIYWQQPQEKKKLEQKKSCLTQKQLNKLFEEPDYDISERYAFILNIMYTTAFFTPLLPFALLFSMGTLLATYFIEKIKILRQRSIRHNLAENLSVDMTDMLEHFLTIYCLSNMIFDYFITKSYAREKDDKAFSFFHDFFEQASTYSFIGVIIGISHAILPMQWVNEQLFKVKQKSSQKRKHKEEQEPYNEENFLTTYEQENPATKKSKDGESEYNEEDY